MKKNRIVNECLDATLKQSRAEPVAIFRTDYEQMIYVLGGIGNERQSTHGTLKKLPVLPRDFSPAFVHSIEMLEFYIEYRGLHLIEPAVHAEHFRMYAIRLAVET